MRRRWLILLGAASLAACVPGAFDLDGDGEPDATDCAPEDASIHRDAADPIDAEGLDSNCDGVDGIDRDGDGWASRAGDCDDDDPLIHPDAVEVDDPIDHDCNGVAWPTAGCSDDLGEIVEEELNHPWQAAQDLGALTAPGTCVTGRITCGDGTGGYRDEDWFDLVTEGRAHVRLRWTTLADLDVIVWDESPGPGTPVKPYYEGIGDLEEADVEGRAGTWTIGVGCFDGPKDDEVLWSLEVRPR